MMALERNAFIKNLNPIPTNVKRFNITLEAIFTKICCVNPKYFAFVAQEYKGSIVKVYKFQTKETLYIDADKEAIIDIQFNPFNDNMIMAASKINYLFLF